MSTARAWTLSVPDKENLIKAAIAVKEHAYSPYSKFRVGAALLMPDGRIISGANVENASSGGTICAERSAIVRAVSEGTRSFVALAVTSDVPQAISPCGICRQVLREFCKLDMPILMVPADYPQAPAKEGEPEKVGFGTLTEGGVWETTLGALLPASFGPEDLELPRVTAK